MLDFMLCLGRRSKRNRGTEHRQQSSQSKMLVSEGSIFNQQSLKIKIVTLNGSEWEMDIDPDLTVEKIKLMAVGHFYNSTAAETIKTDSQYKLILVCQNRQLNNEASLTAEGVEDHDELLLLKMRAVTSQSATSTQDEEIQSKGPDETIIRQHTSSLEAKNDKRVAEEAVTALDFQTELRKILVSLIDAAQKLQLLNENTLPLFTNSQEMPTGVSIEAIDPMALGQLTDMGFSAKQATEALILNKMSAMDALECLLSSDCTVDETGAEDEPNSPVSPFSATQDIHDKSTSSTITSDTSPEVASVLNMLSLPDLMEAFRAYKRKEFWPNPKAFSNLREMGFDEEKITDSLRVSENNQDAAFEWLISRWPTIQDFCQGLDTEGAIYKAIIANPVIQLGMNSPKVLYAFLHMLENPNCANRWLRDPDTAPLLIQIFKIYHAEKYSLQIRSLVGHS